MEGLLDNKKDGVGLYYRQLAGHPPTKAGLWVSAGLEVSDDKRIYTLRDRNGKEVEYTRGDTLLLVFLPLCIEFNVKID